MPTVMWLLLVEHLSDELGRSPDDGANDVLKVEVARAQHVGAALVSECDEVVVIRVSRDGGYLDRIRRRLDEQFDVGHEPVELLAGAPAEELVSGQDSS